MVLINDIEIPVYEVDNRDNVEVRIAATFDTLPKYLYFPNKFPDIGGIGDQANHEMINLLSLIEKASNEIPLKEFVQNHEKLLEGKDLKEEILPIWLMYNTKLKKAAANEHALLSSSQGIIDAYFSSNDETNFTADPRADFLAFYNTVSRFREKLNSQIAANKKENERLISIARKFNSIENDWVYTSFKPTETSLKFEIDLAKFSILELFNSIRLDVFIPFAYCNNYYKIFKNFIPDDSWSTTENNVLLLRVNPKQSVSDEYIEVRMEVNDDRMIATTKLINDKGYLSQQAFLDRLVSVFTFPIKFSNITETHVTGIFHYPSQTMNTYVFSDLALMDEFFRTMINVDESLKATKKKPGYGIPWLYFHFEHYSTGDVGVSIVQKTFDGTDGEVREYQDLFEQGSLYLRVRVKGENIKAVENFQKLFSKLMAIYDEKFNEIVQIYREYLPDFGVITLLETKEIKKKNKFQAPELFVTNYSRNCKVLPVIVSEIDAEKARKEGKKVILFPRNVPEKGQTYPSDGKNQKYYICTDPDYKYPGLQVNKLENADVFPYRPCCFKRDQSDRKGDYSEYYFGEKTVNYREKKQNSELIITDKILKDNKHGVLSAALETLFGSIDTDHGYKYVRAGVPRDYNSLLNCILLAKSNKKILKMDEEEQKAYVIKKRQKLVDVAYLARQCMYQSSVEEIAVEIASNAVYFDPKNYIQLVEEEYDCNIVIFNKDSIVVPNYSQAYYRFVNNKKCIFIYEHWGSESDHAKYPQCELIVRWNTKKSTDVQYIFDQEQSIAEGMLGIFYTMINAYRLNQHITPVIYPNVEILAQQIDFFGKTRHLHVAFNGKKLSLLTSPMPAVNAHEVKNLKVRKISLVTAVAFLESVANVVTNKSVANVVTNKSVANVVTNKSVANVGNKAVTSQTIHDDLVTEVSGMLGNISITIPIKVQVERLNVPIKTSLSYTITEPSVIQKYNENKKLARYITEYAFWYFSRYINDKKIPEINDSVLNDFSKTILIKPEFVYGSVSQYITTDSGVCDNGKLIVTSEEMLKRVMYVIKLFSIRDLNTLLAYYQHTTITHYYVDISDFTTFQSQIILEGDDSIYKYIQEHKFSYKLHREVLIGHKMPYFFKNLLVKDEVFLAQNVESVEKALSIAIAWQQKGYNIGKTVEKETKKYPFTLYAYHNEQSITVHEVKGTDESIEPIGILGYKLDNVPFFTVLMGLNNDQQRPTLTNH